MAVKKATTRAALTASGEPASPSLEEDVARVSEVTSDEMKADVKSPKSVKVKSPFGSVTEVPEGIVDALLESGYSKSK
jgi:hypothetical protein